MAKEVKKIRDTETGERKAFKGSKVEGKKEEAERVKSFIMTMYKCIQLFIPERPLNPLPASPAFSLQG